MGKHKLFVVAGATLLGAALSACGGGGSAVAPKVSYIIDENNPVYKVIKQAETMEAKELYKKAMEEINGKDFTGMTPRQTGAFLQMIFQDANSSFDPRRVMKKSILESGRGKKDEGRILELVSLVGLEEDLLSRKPSSLSGGQCQRMAIARAFYSDADILLCDEMTSALDVTTQAQVVELLQDLKKDGRLSAVFVSHDIALVSMLCDRVMVMKDGKCVEEGDTLTVIKHPCADYTKELLESARRQSIQELSE